MLKKNCVFPLPHHILATTTKWFYSINTHSVACKGRTGCITKICCRKAAVSRGIYRTTWSKYTHVHTNRHQQTCAAVKNRGDLLWDNTTQGRMAKGAKRTRKRLMCFPPVLLRGSCHLTVFPLSTHTPRG